MKMEANGKCSKQSESRIPILSPSPLRRSGSLRLGIIPPIKEHKNDVNQRPLLNRHRSLQSLNTARSFNCDTEDDVDSVKSFSSVSGASVCSNVSQCDHAHFARNGTTYSGRCKRYVYHCSPHSTETDDYLTPTQRTNRTIRRLRSLLKEAQEELANKDKEIQRLTKEVVELRLLKMDASGDAEGEGEGAGGGGGDGHSPSHVSTSNNGYCSSPLPLQSLTDSGHFEELNSSHTVQSQIRTLESTLRQYEDEIRELKEKHNDKVESLLQRITDVNDRYYALRPLYEDCKEKLHELEKQNEGHITRIAELECLNERLLQDKDGLVSEIEHLKRIIANLEISKVNHDKLEVENVQVKNNQDKLSSFINRIKEEKCGNFNKIDEDKLDSSSQTENCNLFNGVSDEIKDTHFNFDEYDYKKENSELKFQNAALSEKIKQLEEQQQKEQDVYPELYKKGIQATKFMEAEEVQSNESQEHESPLIPELLHKLKIKQEELDNVKAMYRRLLETRKEQPKHDPEMTLQFLKSAFYYFLTDRENAQGHLSAIESILGFTDNEKINIERAFLWR